jgi:hypothetical protein
MMFAVEARYRDGYEGLTPSSNIELKRYTDPELQISAQLGVELGLRPSVKFTLSGLITARIGGTAYLTWHNDFNYPAFEASTEPYEPVDFDRSTTLFHYGDCSVPHYIQYGFGAGLKDVTAYAEVDLTQVIEYYKNYALHLVEDKGPYNLISGCLAEASTDDPAPLSSKVEFHVLTSAFYISSDALIAAFKYKLATDLAMLASLPKHRFHVESVSSTSEYIRVIVVILDGDEASSNEKKIFLDELVESEDASLKNGEVTAYLVPQHQVTAYLVPHDQVPVNPDDLPTHNSTHPPGSEDVKDRINSAPGAPAIVSAAFLIFFF